MALSGQDELLALTLTSGLGPVLTRRCLDFFGSAGGVLGAGVQRLAEVAGIGRQRAEAIRVAMDGVMVGGAVEKEKMLIEEHGVRLLVLGEAGYPVLLKHIHDPPVVLYVKGGIEEGDALAVAIVGSRRSTFYGREQAGRFAGLLARAGLCVVSGGAYGVDVAAHRAAVRVGGRTVVVLGSGLAEYYPKEHGDLFEQIAGEGKGVVVSELPMGTAPAAENFPRRNRIISGLALGVLVVEAAERSGALITARLAGEEHGREVMAVPGRVDSAASAGCHKMIREGWATLVTNAADVLDALGETGALLKAGLIVPGGAGQRTGVAEGMEKNLSESQRRIVGALTGQGGKGVDQLAAATGLAVGTVQADITVLQIRGLVRKEGREVCRVR